MNRSAPLEARWIRAWMPETVGSGIASAAVAAPPVAGMGVRLARRPMSSVSWSIATTRGLPKVVERVAGTDHDDDADVRHLAGMPGGGRFG